VPVKRQIQLGYRRIHENAVFNSTLDDTVGLLQGATNYIIDDFGFIWR
jgi:hypothetical protein